MSIRVSYICTPDCLQRKSKYFLLCDIACCTAMYSSFLYTLSGTLVGVIMLGGTNKISNDKSIVFDASEKNAWCSHSCATELLVHAFLLAGLEHSGPRRNASPIRTAMNPQNVLMRAMLQTIGTQTYCVLTQSPGGIYFARQNFKALCIEQQSTM